MQIYQMKDLGYARTPTSAMMRVTMPDGSRWDVPVQAIVDSLDEFYSDEKQDIVAFIRNGDRTAYAIRDWAAGDMNWDEVQPYAIEAPRSTVNVVDYQEGWVNGEKELVGQL